MTNNKLMSTISTFPNEPKSTFRLYPQTQSYHSIKNPFNQVLPIKFPKKKIRKPTEMNMLT